MKILVINNQLEEKHFELIKKNANEIGAEVFFYKNETEIPEDIMIPTSSMDLHPQS